MAERRPSHLFFRSMPLLLLLALGLRLPLATAQEQPKNPTIRVVHRPPESQMIPAPGILMPISVQLPRTAEINTKVRLVGSRDGRFMDIAFPMGQFEEGAYPTFTIEVPAPTVAMTYQFIVHQTNGDLTLSEKFTLKRPCIVPTPSSVQDNESKQYREQVIDLIAHARALERENLNLEASLKLLDGLKKDLSE